jgi:excisionase family DNA binding protein
MATAAEKFPSITMHQASKHFGVSYQTFRNWLRENETLRAIAYKPGSHILFRLEDLDAWFATQTLAGARRDAW